MKKKELKLPFHGIDKQLYFYFLKCLYNVVSLCLDKYKCLTIKRL